MQISLKWIHELVNLQTINLEDLIDKLTLGGFEVEEVLEVQIANTKITALDISTTANRSDSLSIQGLSLEIASLLNQIPKTLSYSTEIYSWKKYVKTISLNNEIHTDCLGFIALTIENLNDFSSPKWLKQKLLVSGIMPKNSLLDFQSYITLETGYPLELYDFQKIQEKIKSKRFQFHLTNPKNSKHFIANNDKHYQLDDSILMITANDFPISIAGIIPSKASSYSNVTHSLIVEGSIFNAVKIRQESRLLGLRTDRSSRYEKSLKNTTLFDSIYRLISLLRIANPTLVCKLHTFDSPLVNSIQVIELNYSKIKQVLGPIEKNKDNIYRYIHPEIITDLLERLQFDIQSYSSNDEDYKWQIGIPSRRSNDITQEIDLIEEIGRIYGFNRFLIRLPIIKMPGSEDSDYQIRKKLTLCLINLGLNELIQYSLVNSETYLKNDIQLINPLVKDFSHLRSSLLPSLIKAIQENYKKGNFTLEGFEYGHVFSTDSSQILEEVEYVAGIFGGIKIRSNWSTETRTINWFEAKGKLDQLFKKLNINIHWKSYTPFKEEYILHPYRTACLSTVNGTKLGIFGQISPLLAKKLNISLTTYLFEFNFEVIKAQIQQNKLRLYQEYSLYPKIIKDLSFIIKEDIPFTKIKESLYLNGSEFLTEIYLLDNYKGKTIPNKHISLCLQLIFHSNFKTLQNKEVETIINNLLQVLIKKFNVTIRK